MPQKLVMVTARSITSPISGTQRSKGKPFRPIDYLKPKPSGIYWMLRQDQKTRSLPADRLALVIAAMDRHNERCRQKSLDICSQYQTTKETMQTRRHDAVSQIVKRLYRISKSYWVGGKTEIKVKIGATAEAGGYSTYEWSDNGKWPGTNLYLSVTIQPTWLSQIENVPGLADAGGKLTTHAELVGPGLWKASWLEQGRGFNLKAANGYILLKDGRFCHGRSEYQVHRGYKRVVQVMRETGLRDARWRNSYLVGKGLPVPAEILVDFPELVEETNHKIQAKKRHDLECTLSSGGPIDVDFLAAFPDLLEGYHQQHQMQIILRLEHGEHVDFEEINRYPNLIMEYGV